MAIDDVSLLAPRADCPAPDAGVPGACDGPGCPVWSGDGACGCKLGGGGGGARPAPGRALGALLLAVTVARLRRTRRRAGSARAGAAGGPTASAA